MHRSDEPRRGPWLLLIHQLPPKPPYFRAKIGRHLARIGAVAIKNSVYALPATPQTREDFAWVYREITGGGGEATVCEARLVEGLSDEQLEALFHAARNADYEALAGDVRAAQKAFSKRGRLSAERRDELAASVLGLKKRLAEITTIDFFAATGRITLDGLLRGLDARLLEASGGPPGRPAATMRADEVRGRTWVTRKGIHVDRIASAWLVRRFLDPDARFKFVASKGYLPEPGELRFDMFEAEFTHEGDRCTFEVLLDRFGLDDAGLRAIGEIVHDIDLKDARFGRAEKAGIERLIAGIALTQQDDEARLSRGAALFDDLHESFARKAGPR
jgi:hypothetical protein